MIGTFGGLNFLAKIRNPRVGAKSPKGFTMQYTVITVDITGHEARETRHKTLTAALKAGNRLDRQLDDRRLPLKVLVEYKHEEGLVWYGLDGEQEIVD